MACPWPWFILGHDLSLAVACPWPWFVLGCPWKCRQGSAALPRGFVGVGGLSRSRSCLGVRTFQAEASGTPKALRASSKAALHFWEVQAFAPHPSSACWQQALQVFQESALATAGLSWGCPVGCPLGCATACPISHSPPHCPLGCIAVHPTDYPVNYPRS